NQISMHSCLGTSNTNNIAPWVHGADTKKSGLVICCPISTSIRGHITEVRINNLDTPCVAAANLIQTLSWKDRSMKFGVVADEGVLDGVLARLIPLIGGEHFFID
ncbi:hypothetical protein ABN070_17200, partial [Morganella morganii]|uniref:hypothetical protein n=1 Tax=Morganella morganii TaxID=582 RepID=UPI0032DB1EB0